MGRKVVFVEEQIFKLLKQLRSEKNADGFEDDKVI